MEAQLPESDTPRPGKRPATVKLAGTSGGLVSNGSAWSSDSLTGTVSMLVYVDPDERDLNEALAQRLKEEKFDRKLFRSVAVINMRATWKPNAILDPILRGKQKEFPDTLYVKDMDSVLVNEWGLADQTYDVLLFDQAGRVLFRKDGKLETDEIEAFLGLVRENLNNGNPRAASTLDKVTL
jgi:hypothetical protein